jgi:UDP-glucose 4-epimerase
MTGSPNGKMNVLVTGAAGFIGSHLCHELVQHGYKVFGLSHSGNTENIKPLLQQTNFHLMRGDIRDSEAIDRLLKDHNIGAIFHLAAQLPWKPDSNNPFLSFDVNARGTLNLLHAACLNKVERFIYSSSIDVYSGPPEYLPVDEKHPTQPHTHYGIGKLAGELYTQLYATNMKVTVLRYSIGYGRGGKPGGAVNQFIHQALNNEPLRINGDGNQSNDFVYVKDEAKSNLLALEQDKPGIYNIGSGEETSVKALAHTILQLTGSSSEILFTPEESNRPFRFALDISLARKVLGYQPYSLHQGLAEHINSNMRK